MRIANRVLALTFLAVNLPSLGQAQLCVQPPVDIVSWWPAEMSAEDVIGDNEGALQNGAGFEQGVVGSAFNLSDFSTEHVLVDDDPSLNIQEFTIEGWVRTPGLINSFVASKSAESGILGYELGIHPNTVVRFTINGGINAADLIGTTSITDNQWHHVAATYKTPRAKIYVDGVLDAQQVIDAAVLYEDGTSFFIGARRFPGIPGYCPGQIDELTFYSRALFSTEIEGIFNVGSAGKCDGGIVLPWPIFQDDFELGDTSEWTTTVP